MSWDDEIACFAFFLHQCISSDEDIIEFERPLKQRKPKIDRESAIRHEFLKERLLLTIHASSPEEQFARRSRIAKTLVQRIMEVVERNYVPSRDITCDLRPKLAIFDQKVSGLVSSYCGIRGSLFPCSGQCLIFLDCPARHTRIISQSLRYVARSPTDDAKIGQFTHTRNPGVGKKWEFGLRYPNPKRTGVHALI
jgi:hypothetical protein